MVHNSSVWNQFHFQPYRICFCLQVTLSIFTSAVFLQGISSEMVTILSALTRLEVEDMRLVFGYPD
jgi:hypothetical protein